jgi:hypothetical protein
MMIKELLDKALEEITTLHGPSLVVVFIILLGYALKMIPAFPNKLIPLVSFVIGPILTPIMVGWPDTGSIPPGVRWPEYASWATVLVQGFLFACIAWIMHGKVLRKLIDDKVPALNPGRTVQTATLSAVDMSGQEVVKESSKVVTDKPEPTAPITAPPETAGTADDQGSGSR